ncbi:MAG: hypothetical protein Q8S44_03990 [Flavobacteriaceae bacterium]|nr:hypothetical protein [Flavobacteriaceae bacterium]
MTIMLFINNIIVSQSIPTANCVCSYCNVKCGSGHSTNCTYYSAPKAASKIGVIPATNINNMVAGMVFQSLLNAVFSSNTNTSQQQAEAQQAAALAAQQAAEEKKAQEKKAQEEYDRMMQLYKTLDGSQNLLTKSLGDTNLDFKTLDGEAENLSTAARNQFEGLSTNTVTDSTTIGGGTQFFGDSMPIVDLQSLEDLNNNPNVVDLRETQKYVEENIENDSLQIVSILRQYEPDANGEPIIQKQDCRDLAKKLKVYINQREQTKKILDLSNNELNIWETANQNALMNQVKDGLEYFAGNLFDKLSKRGKAADRLQGILNKNSNKMVKEGINIADIQAKIDNLRLISTAGELTDLANKMNDWTTFMKDGFSSLLLNLSSSNNEINEIIENPQMQQYFQMDKPELNTLLDISKIVADNEMMGKWVAKKLPMIALVDISIKTLYNGTDYFLSLNRIMESRKIYGGALETAKYIQKNIDDSYKSLSECPNN